MAPVKISLYPHYENDSWPGMEIGPILINDTAPDYDLASCKMQFRDADETLGHEFNTVPGSGIGTITIDNAVTWEVTVPVQLLNLEAGTWYWDFETVDSEGVKRTIYYGKIKVKGDVTK